MVCGFCGTKSLLAGGQLRRLKSLRVPERHGAAQHREALAEKLRASSFTEIPESEEQKNTVRYLVRRGRARASPRSSSAMKIEVPEVREGFFGLPLGDEHALPLLYLPDLSGLVPAREAPPQDLEDHLLRFDDRMHLALRAERDAGLARAVGVEPGRVSTKEGYDTHMAWHDDIYLLDLTMTTLSFRYTDTPTRLFTRWVGTNERGEYSAVFSDHDASVLRWDVPRKGKNIITFIIMFLAIVTLPGMFAGCLGVAAGLAATLGVSLPWN